MCVRERRREKREREKRQEERKESEGDRTEKREQRDSIHSIKFGINMSLACARSLVEIKITELLRFIKRKR